MSDAAAIHTKLQSDQHCKNLAESERDLAAARQDAQELRRLMIGFGQSFVPELFVRESKAQLESLPATELATRISHTLGQKLAKLTAFQSGLTPEQQARWIRRTLDANATEWVNDPALERAKATTAAEHQARLVAEEKTRAAEAHAAEIVAQQKQARRELGHLHEEMRRLQEAYQSLQTSVRRTDAPVLAGVSDPTNATILETGASPVSGSDQCANDSAAKACQKTKEECARQLVFEIATRGICERPRVAQLLRDGLKLPDANHYLINDAFQLAMSAQWLESLIPRTESVGRPPTLLRLTERGREFARQELQVEPVPSELDELFKVHGSDVAHIALILQSRALFWDGKYPMAIVEVDVMPAPISLEDGKTYEPDMVVTLADQTLLFIECERDARKNPAQRADKWAKYFQAAHGEFYIICPDAKTASRLGSEINQWHVSHGGRLHLRITSLAQLKKSPHPFWAYERHL